MPEDHPSGPGESAGLDAAVWGGVSAVVLALLPIGAVSGDAIMYSQMLPGGGWSLNPNHLLLEPAMAAWLDIASALGLDRPVPDRLKLFSVLCGALAVGLFRWLVAPRVADGRLEGNHATAWFSLGAGFVALWVSGEGHMLQMPFLVLGAAAALEHGRSGELVWAVGSALSVAAAALAYISNAVVLAGVVAALVILHVVRGRPRVAGVVGLSAAAAAVTLLAGGLLAGCMASGCGGLGFADWVMSYRGGGGTGIARGLGASLAELAYAAARAIYGTANVVVDLAPTVEAVRDQGSFPAWSAGAVGASLASVALLGGGAVRLWGSRDRSGRRAAFLVATAWCAAVLAFGVYWNNSDDQFYFQLAVPMGMLAAAVPAGSPGGGRWIAAAGAAALAWNVGAAVQGSVLYPRGDRVAALGAAVEGAGLVVYPGHGEVGRLLYFVDRDLYGESLSVMSLAQERRPDEGLRDLEVRVRGELSAGRPVHVIDVFDVPPLQLPWKALAELGYPQEEVAAVLGRFPRRPGPAEASPFTVGVLQPPGRETTGGEDRDRGARDGGHPAERYEPKRNRGAP